MYKLKVTLSDGDKAIIAGSIQKDFVDLTKKELSAYLSVYHFQVGPKKKTFGLDVAEHFRQSNKSSRVTTKYAQWVVVKWLFDLKPALYGEDAAKLFYNALSMQPAYGNLLSLVYEYQS